MTASAVVCFLTAALSCMAQELEKLAGEAKLSIIEAIDRGTDFGTPAGTLEGCLETEESTPLEGGREFRHCAPGTGLLRDADKRARRGPAS
jgi:hypothetical protein